jgi:lysophospholipase L1-like esterase
MMNARAKSPIAIVLGSVLVCAGSLLALEGAGRILMHVKYGVPGKRYGRWRSDPVLGARMAENVYDHRWSTNDRGFRNDEDLIDPKPTGAMRVICYGGSTTLCWNLPTRETWPARLEERIRDASENRSHQVMNAGDILWSIGPILARARTELPALRPDYVILYTGVNEEANAALLAASGVKMETLVRAGRFGVFSKNLPQNSWLARNSLLYKVANKWLIVPLVRRWKHWTHDRWSELLLTESGPEHPPVPPDPYVMENYLHVLQDLITLCRDNGATPIFVIEARGLGTVGLETFTSYSRAGGLLAQELGVEVVDAQAMVEAYPGERMDLFYASGIHFSTQGAALLADRIFEQVYQPGIQGR